VYESETHYSFVNLRKWLKRSWNSLIVLDLNKTLRYYLMGTPNMLQSLKKPMPSFSLMFVKKYKYKLPLDSISSFHALN